MAEGGDRTDSMAEAPPTLLWDSYDLHDLRQDTHDRLSDVSLGNWELEEQRELQAVEEILDRTAGILQEEENVRAQEEVLDVLLKVDQPDRLWSSWNLDVQQMSCSDLAEAGVLGLDDLSSPVHFDYHEDVSSSALNSEVQSHTDELLHEDRSEILQELEDLRVLEARILEEQLKIQELRVSEKTPERRRRFLEALEREKEEVEEMERSLNREERKRREGKLKKSRTKKVVKCSIMEMASALGSFEEDDSVCDGTLLMNCRRLVQQCCDRTERAADKPPNLATEFIQSRESDQCSTPRPSEPSPYLTTEESVSSKPSTFGPDEDSIDLTWSTIKPSDLAVDSNQGQPPNRSVKDSTSSQVFKSTTDAVVLCSSYQPHELPLSSTSKQSASSEPSGSFPDEFITSSVSDSNRQSVVVADSDQSQEPPPCFTTEHYTNCQSSTSTADETVGCLHSGQSMLKFPCSTRDSHQFCEPLEAPEPPPHLTTDKPRDSNPSDSSVGEFDHCLESHEPPQCLTTEESTKPQSSAPDDLVDSIDSSLSTFKPGHSVTDSNQSHKPPHLTNEQSTTLKPPNLDIDELIQALNQELLDLDCEEMCPSSDLYQKTQDGSESVSSEPDILPANDSSLTMNTQPEKNKMFDSTVSEQPPTSSETGQDTEPILVGTSKLVINKDEFESTLESHGNTAQSDMQSKRLVPPEGGQEQAAFDPGGSKPQPRIPRQKRPVPCNRTCVSEEKAQLNTDSINTTAACSPSVLAPPSDPQLEEHQTPPKINLAAAEYNRNNNNLRGVDQNQPCTETFLLEIGYPEGLSEAIDQTQVSGTKSNPNVNTRNDDGPSTRVVCRSPVQQQLQICTRDMSDFQTPVVLDTGSGLVKAGFADQDLPTIIFPTAIGTPKYEEVMSSTVGRDVYIGHDAQHMRGVLTLHYPMKNGIIGNWDQMEMIWLHVFEQLCVECEDHPVLLTEGVMNPQADRQRMVQLMFETFNVPLTFLALQPVLALYAAGRTTGVVFDSGDGVSHSVPVFDGYSLPHAVQRFTLAGDQVTLQLKKLLLEQGVCMRTSAEMEIVREIKERCCRVALDYEAELGRGGGAATSTQYTLPDGQVVSLTTERFRAPEILFKPELIGCDYYGMHESIFRSVLQSDIDLRKSLLGNIILSGGNTLLAGLPERLQWELGRLAPVGMCESVRVISPPDRDFSVWKGGAVLSGLQTFSSAWIGREEYDEYGPNIVHRKCF